jgi:hypothetical protein
VRLMRKVAELSRDQMLIAPWRCSVFRLMKVAPISGRSIALILAMPLLACQHEPTYLPSRPIGQMFPRASSPPPSCPGQYRSVIEDAHGDFFIGCWGHKTD